MVHHVLKTVRHVMLQMVVLHAMTGFTVSVAQILVKPTV